MFPPGSPMDGSPPPIDLSALGGGPQDSGPPQGGPPPDSGGSNAGDPIELVNQASDLIRQAISAEPDHEDKLLLEKITTFCQQYIATQQKLVDNATGAGPGAKVIRKSSGGGPY